MIAVDPGCARMLMVDAPELAVAPEQVMPLVDLIYAELDQVPALAHQTRRCAITTPASWGAAWGATKSRGRSWRA